MHNKRLVYEKQLWSEGYSRIMGLDEVGRGCLAGPVVAAGVILAAGSNLDKIKDSKTLDEKTRKSLAAQIKNEAVFWTIQEGSLDDIARLNILWASIHTMHKCALSEGANPDYLLVDGNKFTPLEVPHSCIIKGDDKSQSIGAASILAKVYRDELMTSLSKDFPEFRWDSNVGYPTPIHKKALKEFGYTEHHRKTFKLGTEKVYKRK